MAQQPHDHRVLVLSSSYRALGTTSLPRAVHMVLLARAELVDAAGTLVRSANRAVPLPLVIRLTHSSAGSSPRKPVPVTRRRVLARDAHRCAYCAAPADTIDHVIPRSRPAGTHSWTNVVAACRTCNNRKANRTPEQAGMRLLRTPRAPLPGDLVRMHATRTTREPLPSWEPWLR